MQILFSIFMSVLAMGIVPLLIGRLWHLPSSRESYAMGFFTMFALFQIICVPCNFLRTSFSVVIILFDVVLCVLCGLSLYKNRTKLMPSFQKPNGIEWIYVLLLVASISVQLYFLVFGDLGYFSADDSWYVAIANHTAQNNEMITVYAYTGGAYGDDISRYLQSSLLYISWLARTTNFSVPVIAHTVFAINVLFGSYCIHSLIADRLFDEKDNRLIYILFVSVLYTFGYYSHYSTTFRLMGTICQGKGILAVMLVPYLYSILPSFYKEFSLQNGFRLCVISIAACSMTLGGVISMAMFLGVFSLLAIVRKHFKTAILYLMIGGIIPLIDASIYMFLK